MMILPIIVFALLVAASHTLTPIQNGANIILEDGSTQSQCRVEINQLLGLSYIGPGYIGALFGDWECPLGSDFPGGYCCCYNCTSSEAPFLYNWFDVPSLPRFSERPVPLAEGYGFTFPNSPMWFLVSFGPTILTVIYSILWNTIDVTVKKLHPFTAMAEVHGRHSDSGTEICFTYLDKNSLLVPYYAFRNGDRLVFVVSLLDLSAAVLVTLFTGCFQLQIFTVQVIGGTTFGRSPAIQRPLIYATEALLVCMVLGIAYFIWLLRRGHIYVYSDPTGMASVFAMAHPSIRRAIRAIDSGISADDLSPAKLDEAFQSLSPQLRYVNDEASGATRYQIVVENSPNQPRPKRSQNKSNSWIKKLFSSSVPGMVTTLAVLAAFIALDWILSYQAGLDFTVYDERSARFCGLGMTALAVLLKILWAAHERGMYITSKYMGLHESN
jgi:hypothetical protein